MNTGMNSGRKRDGLYVAVALLLGLTGCAGDGEKIVAINAVNQTFRADYEKIIVEKGTRVFDVQRDDAFVAMRVAMARIRMQTESYDTALGHLVVVAPAPLPLDEAEWRKASEADLPLLRKTVEPHVGAAAGFVRFEPEGLEVVVSATFVETRAGTEISLTARLREVAPPRSGWPRREYLSPTIFRAGLDKIWSVFEQELRAGPKRP